MSRGRGVRTQRFRGKLPEIRQTLVRWSLFSVTIALLPVVLNAFALMTRGQPMSYSAMVGNGELLLVSVAISAGAMGELIAAERQPFTGTWQLLIGLSVVIVLLASAWFADIASAIRAGEYVSRHSIALGSTVVFACATLVGACCIMLSRMTL